MKDKKKAKQIAEESQILSDFPHDYHSVEYGAIEMGKWKDEQFAEMKKQTVEKICEWLENNASKYVYNVLDEYDMQYYAFIHRREMIDHLKSYLEKNKTNKE